VKREGASYYKFTAPLTGEYAVQFRIVGDNLAYNRATPVSLSWKFEHDSSYATNYFSYDFGGSNLLDVDTLLFYVYNGAKNITKGDVIDLRVAMGPEFTMLDGNHMIPRDTHFELTVSYDSRSEGSTNDPIVLSMGESRQCTVLYSSCYAFQATETTQKITFSDPTYSVGCSVQAESLSDSMQGITGLEQPESTSTIVVDSIGQWFAIRCAAFGYNSAAPEHQYLFTLMVQ